MNINMATLLSSLFAMVSAETILTQNFNEYPFFFCTTLYLTTNISEGGVCFWTTVDFLLAVLRLLIRGESELFDEDAGLAGISVSSCNALAFEPVCISNAARAARSLLTQDCREWTTGTDFNEDTGDDGFDDTSESGDFGSWAGFLLDGCAAFGFFDCQQVQQLTTNNIYCIKT